MTIAYVAHPIDQAGHSSWLGSMLGDLNSLLVRAQIGAFRPGMAYLANTADTSHVRYINDMNNIAIHQADCLIAVLPAEVPTLGTPVEIGFALSMRKPVVVFTDISHSVQLAAWVAQGAIILDMSDPLFEWPKADILHDLIAQSAKIQEERPCPVATLVPQPYAPALLVSGEAANAQPGKYKGDAGIDLMINANWSLEPGEFQYLSTGVHVAIPDGYFGWITGRSSTWRDFRCSVVTGVIDSGYRGELMLGVRNESEANQTFESGTRLGQLILIPAFMGELIHSNQLPESERGLNGYGSSGR